MSRRLKALGIRPRPTRNASLMALAVEPPAIVFSRLLGFSEQTAANWMGREWRRGRLVCCPSNPQRSHRSTKGARRFGGLSTLSAEPPSMIASALAAGGVRRWG